MEEEFLDQIRDIRLVLQETPIGRDRLSGQRIRYREAMLDPNGAVSVGVLGGEEMPVIDFAHQFAVFNGSRVHEETVTDSIHDRPPGKYLQITNKQVFEQGTHGKFGIYKDDQDETLAVNFNGMIIEEFILQPNTEDNLGTIAFTLCAIQSCLYGIGKIDLTAGGCGKEHPRKDEYNARLYGYNVWPKFGFDAPLDDDEFHDGHVPELKECKTVLDAVEADEEAWKLYGSQRLMTFDLTPNSRSWDKLLNYISPIIKEATDDLANLS